MCLRLTYAEALLWKKNAAKIVADAKAKSATIPCDPLFSATPRLSSLVSEIDGIKKRHGLLIERALIYAINKLTHWEAMKEQIPVAGGKAHLDCLALNTNSGKLYVFECKRGHGSFDGDKISAIDQRLGKIKASIGAHALSKGWAPVSTEVFILSFYGAKWSSAYPIYDKNSVARLFEPCIGSFTLEFMNHLETMVARTYSSELRDSVDVDQGRTIFDMLDEQLDSHRPDVLFTKDGADFVAAQTQD